MSAGRLQKILAHAGVGSRRQVEDMIREGRVTVDGQVADLGQRADLATDAVKVDGRRIQPVARAHRYLLLNKPRGCVSTVSDPEGRPTVLELIPERFRTGLKPVGRLDFETEGLLLLTDDGDLAHRVAHPSFGCTKTYEVKVRGRPGEAAINRLRDGISIDGRRTRPASISSRIGSKGARQSVKNSWWIVTLGEGRTRQIREMFFRIGHPVQRLRRIAIGPLRDPYLPQGQWRDLEEHEIALLQDRLDQGKEPVRSKKAPRPAGWASGGRTSKGRSPKGPTPRGRVSKTDPPKGRTPKSRPPKAGPPKGRTPKAGPPKAGPPKGRTPKGRTPGGPGRGPQRGPSRRG